MMKRLSVAPSESWPVGTNGSGFHARRTCLRERSLASLWGLWERLQGAPHLQPSALCISCWPLRSSADGRTEQADSAVAARRSGRLCCAVLILLSSLELQVRAAVDEKQKDGCGGSLLQYRPAPGSLGRLQQAAREALRQRMSAKG